MNCMQVTGDNFVDAGKDKERVWGNEIEASICRNVPRNKELIMFKVIFRT